MVTPVRRRKPEQDHTSAHAEAFRQTYTLTPIGVLRSPYTERFGTPRQPPITSQVKADRALEARIELLPELAPGLADLAAFERIWCVFLFHLNRGYSLQVRSPRDANTSHSLFATRAPHRPNPIGLSCLHLLRIDGPVIHVRGVDILDHTPVLDIKPYVPYTDAFPSAAAGWLQHRTADEPDAYEPE